MATLTYNASITPSRQITVTAGTGGALTGTVALLIDNTANKFDVAKLIEAIERTVHREFSKASKVPSVSTSSVDLE